MLGKWPGPNKNRGSPNARRGYFCSPKRSNMNQTEKRFLVTGGAGFIGSNLAERLLDEGHTVTVIDNLSGGARENLTVCLRSRRFQFVEKDLLDLEALVE